VGSGFSAGFPRLYVERAAFVLLWDWRDWSIPT